MQSESDVCGVLHSTRNIKFTMTKLEGSYTLHKKIDFFITHLEDVQTVFFYFSLCTKYIQYCDDDWVI